MIIECILKRDGGTIVDLGTKKYLFAPDESYSQNLHGEHPHVCKVADIAHIQLLLAIPEGYREFDERRLPKSGCQSTELDDRKCPDYGRMPEEECINPETMTNKQVLDWGKSIGANPRSKESIQDVAWDKAGLRLDKRSSPVTMLRFLLTEMQKAEIDPPADVPTKKAPAVDAPKEPSHPAGKSKFIKTL